MRAVQITRSGGPEVMDVVDIPDPAPADGEVLYEVSSAGVDRADTHHQWLAQSQHSSRSAPCSIAARWTATAAADRSMNGVSLSTVIAQFLGWPATTRTGMPFLGDEAAEPPALLAEQPRHGQQDPSSGGARAGRSSGGHCGVGHRWFRSASDPPVPTCDVHRHVPVRGAELRGGRREVVADGAR
jgi:hypothetical protein